jgi:adenosylmethionine-8-amino-7-oxononanoate aminotransferase
VFAPSPYCYRCSYGLEPGDCGRRCLEDFRKIVHKEADRTVACIIEPCVQGAGGMIVQPPGFYAEVRDITRQNGLLLIADEVFVGLGHTGAMFASEREGVVPDLMTLGKGLTNGYLPLAATLTTQQIYDAFLADNGGEVLYHGHTFTGNPLGCAAALATLGIFETDGVLGALTPKIERFTAGLARFHELRCVGQVRQCGFIAGIELVADTRTKQAFAPELRMGARVCREARKQGVFVRPLGDVIVLVPQLSIETEDLERLLSVVYESIEATVG